MDSPIAGATGQRLRVLFVTCPRAQCSIYESGQMFVSALRSSTRFDVDEIEVLRIDELPRTGYDVYAFNYHLLTMPRFDTQRVRELPGLKLAFVLEVLPNDPFPLTPDHFDGYCAIDPTMDHPDRRVFAFPRPLRTMADLPPYVERDVPVIGSFGFATPGKNFDQIVIAAGQEFERAVVRLHLPPASHADLLGDRGRKVADACRAVARPGIEVVATHDYMSDDDLVRWCAENTLNCFFYTRKIPGLAATTDQAVIAGRPLLVSDQPTFRHIHRYVRPWPELSLREAIAHSLDGVRAMQRDWSAAAFCQRFEEVLEHFGRLRSATERPRTIPAAPRVQPPTEKRVLVLNHPAERCGIHQYGESTFDALAASSRYDVVYTEVASASEFLREAGRHKPATILYNFHHLTMPWLRSTVIHGVPSHHVGILHEFRRHFLDGECCDLFDHVVVGDPTVSTDNPHVSSVGRIVPSYRGQTEPPDDVLTIGSFGFGFPDKGFDRLVATVCAEFDRARIRLHMPAPDFGDPDGSIAMSLIERCRALISKPGVQLEVQRDFLGTAELLDFLAGNHLNAFLYADDKDIGVSSCLDLALAVRRPIAVSESPMLRHAAANIEPSIRLANRSLRDILVAGASPQDELRRTWTRSHLCARYEVIFDRLAAVDPRANRVPSTVGAIR